MMLLAAALLATGAQAAQLRGSAEDIGFCSGQECLGFLDRVHSTQNCANAKKTNSHYPEHYPYMSCNATRQSLYSMACPRGIGGCRLSFEDPTTALQASLPVSTPEVRDVFKIMRSTFTEKVTTHKYSPLYQKWLGSLSRDGTAPFTFLEVGFAEGFSARAWAKFLPSADVHEMEVSCDVEGFNKGATAEGGASGPHRDLGYCRLHCGDATREDFLEESLKGVEAPLVAVDDGGHGPTEMRDFFQHVWPRLRPGGMLFVEDLAESYAVPHGFIETVAKPLMMDLFSRENKSARLPWLSKDLEAVECREQICVFLKSPPAKGAAPRALA